MMNNEQQYAEKLLILRMTKTYGGFLSRSAQDDKRISMEKKLLRNRLSFKISLLKIKLEI